MNFLSILLYPLSFVYGVVLSVRNMLFNKKILASESFSIPIISVGNLSMGGTGKTPHVEYLIRLLTEKYAIATLSRGYGRKTKGFVEATVNSTSEEIGDEPRQYVHNFPNIKVFVCEDRVLAIKKIISENPDIELILLDDAFQHRKVIPGLNILLTDYRKLFYKDYVLPSGTLREFRCGYKRADVIVVTKSPVVLSPIDARIIIEKIKPLPSQKAFFSKVQFDEMRLIEGVGLKQKPAKIYSILLFAGIANPYPLEEFLHRNCEELETHYFSDHHVYSEKDIIGIREKFNNIASRNKVVVTTQKDAMRIEGNVLANILKDIPIYYIPIKVDFFGEEKVKFNSIIENYVEKNRRNHDIHKS